MFNGRGGGSIKGDVRLDSSLKSGIKTTINGPLGIDEVVLDWLCEEPTVFICAKKRHSRKSGVDLSLVGLEPFSRAAQSPYL